MCRAWRRNGAGGLIGTSDKRALKGRLLTRFDKSPLFIDMSPFAVDSNAQVAAPKFRCRENNPRGSD